MSSIFDDAWKAVLGDNSAAVDEAGDAIQARIVQSIDLINRNLELAREELHNGKTSFITEISETLQKVKSEILAGNTAAAETLRTGLKAQYDFLGEAYDFQKAELVEAYEIISGNLEAAEIESSKEITDARDIARTDLTEGRDTAVETIETGKTEVRTIRNESIGRLRESLTKSLNAISQGESKASKAINDSLVKTRENYKHYVNAGNAAITRAEQLTNDPQAQLDYVQNNPFFSAMQETARDQLFANNAAKGRLGTGGTLDELDKRTLLLGEQLVGNAVDRNLGVSAQGLNAINNLSGIEASGANSLATIFQNAANATANAETNFGNTSANVDNNVSSFLSNLTNSAASIQSNAGSNLANLEQRTGEKLSDITNLSSGRLAEIGANFTGMLNTNSANAAGQYSAALQNFNNMMASIDLNQGAAFADAENRAGWATAGAEQNYKNQYVDLILGGTDSVVGLLNTLGNSEAQEVIGEADQESQAMNTLLNIVSFAATGVPMFQGKNGGFGGFSTGGGGGGGSSPYGNIGTPQNSVGPIAPQYGGYQAPTFQTFNPPPYNPFQFSNGK